MCHVSLRDWRALLVVIEDHIRRNSSQQIRLPWMGDGGKVERPGSNLRWGAVYARSMSSNKRNSSLVLSECEIDRMTRGLCAKDEVRRAVIQTYPTHEFPM